MKFYLVACLCIDMLFCGERDLTPRHMAEGVNMQEPARVCRRRLIFSDCAKKTVQDALPNADVLDCTQDVACTSNREDVINALEKVCGFPKDMWGYVEKKNTKEFFKKTYDSLKNNSLTLEKMIEKADQACRALAKKQGVDAWFVQETLEDVNTQIGNALAVDDLRYTLWARCVLMDTLIAKTPTYLNFWQDVSGFEVIGRLNQYESVKDVLQQYGAWLGDVGVHTLRMLMYKFLRFKRDCDYAIDSRFTGINALYVTCDGVAAAQYPSAIMDHLVAGAFSTVLVPVCVSEEVPSYKNGVWGRTDAYVHYSGKCGHLERYGFLFNSLFESTQEISAYAALFDAISDVMDAAYDASAHCEINIARSLVAAFRATHTTMAFPNLKGNKLCVLKNIFCALSDAFDESMTEVMRLLARDEPCVDGVGMHLMQDWGELLWDSLHSVLCSRIYKKDLIKNTHRVLDEYPLVAAPVAQDPVAEGVLELPANTVESDCSRDFMTVKRAIRLFWDVCQECPNSDNSDLIEGSSALAALAHGVYPNTWADNAPMRPYSVFAVPVQHPIVVGFHSMLEERMVVTIPMHNVMQGYNASVRLVQAEGGVPERLNFRFNAHVAFKILCGITSRADAPKELYPMLDSKATFIYAADQVDVMFWQPMPFEEKFIAPASAAYNLSKTFVSLGSGGKSDSMKKKRFVYTARVNQKLKKLIGGPSNEVDSKMCELFSSMRVKGYRCEISGNTMTLPESLLAYRKYLPCVQIVSVAMQSGTAAPNAFSSTHVEVDWGHWEVPVLNDVMRVCCMSEQLHAHCGFAKSMWGYIAQGCAGDFVEQMYAEICAQAAPLSSVIEHIHGKTRALAVRKGVEPWFVKEECDVVNKKIMDALETTDERQVLWVLCLLFDTVNDENTNVLNLWSSAESLRFFKRSEKEKQGGDAGLLLDIFERFRFLLSGVVESETHGVHPIYSVTSNTNNFFERCVCVVFSKAFLPIVVNETEISADRGEPWSATRLCVDCHAQYSQLSRYAFLFNNVFETVGDNNKLAFETLWEVIWGQSESVYKESENGMYAVARLLITASHALNAMFAFPDVTDTFPWLRVFSSLDVFSDAPYRDMVSFLSHRDTDVPHTLQSWGSHFSCRLSTALNRWLQHKNIAISTQHIARMSLGESLNVLTPENAKRVCARYVQKQVPEFDISAIKNLGMWSVCTPEKVFALPVNDLVMMGYFYTGTRTLIVTLPTEEALQREGDLLSDALVVFKILCGACERIDLVPDLYPMMDAFDAFVMAPLQKDTIYEKWHRADFVCGEALARYERLNAFKREHDKRLRAHKRPSCTTRSVKRHKN